MLLAVLWVKFKFSDVQLPGRGAREKWEEGGSLVELGEIEKNKNKEIEKRG